MATPSVSQMLDTIRILQNTQRKAAFVPSQPPGDPAAGGMPPGAGGAPPMDPAAGGMPPGAGGMPPMDPAAGGMPPMDPAAGGMPPEANMMAPDGTSIAPPDGGGGGGGGSGGGSSGVKIKPEDIVVLQQQGARVLAEMNIQRNLILDLFKQLGVNVSPDTLRGGASAMGDIVNPQAAVQTGLGG